MSDLNIAGELFGGNQRFPIRFRWAEMTEKRQILPGDSTRENLLSLNVAAGQGKWQNRHPGFQC